MSTKASNEELAANDPLMEEIEKAEFAAKIKGIIGIVSVLGAVIAIAIWIATAG